MTSFQSFLVRGVVEFMNKNVFQHSFCCKQFSNGVNLELIWSLLLLQSTNHDEGLVSLNGHCECSHQPQADLNVASLSESSTCVLIQ